jgi:hypothetical protein
MHFENTTMILSFVTTLTCRFNRQKYPPEFVSPPFNARFRISFDVAFQSYLRRFGRVLAIFLTFDLYLGRFVDPYKNQPSDEHDLGDQA